MSRTAVILLPLIACSALAQPAAEDAAGILQRVEATYQNLKSYHFAGVVETDSRMKGMQSKSATEFNVAYSEPDKFRVEFRYPNAGRWIRLSDGKTFVAFRSETNEATQRAYDQGDLRILTATQVDGFSHIVEDAKSATLTGSEDLTIGGKAIPCYVIEMQSNRQSMIPGLLQLPVKVWIDKERNIVLRRVSGTRTKNGDSENLRTLNITLAEINQPEAGQLFALTASDRKK